MVNRWVEHIRKFARENNKSYGCALSDPACKASYTPLPKKPTQKSERASMGANDVNQAKKPKTLRERMRVAGNRANASAYLDNRVADARGKLEQMGMAGEDRNVGVRTFKNKKSNKSAAKLGAIRSIGKSATTVLPYQGAWLTKERKPLPTETRERFRMSSEDILSKQMNKGIALEQFIKKQENEPVNRLGLSRNRLGMISEDILAKRLR